MNFSDFYFIWPESPFCWKNSSRACSFDSGEGFKLLEDYRFKVKRGY